MYTSVNTIILHIKRCRVRCQCLSRYTSVSHTTRLFDCYFKNKNSPRPWPTMIHSTITGFLCRCLSLYIKVTPPELVVPVWTPLAYVLPFKTGNRATKRRDDISVAAKRDIYLTSAKPLPWVLPQLSTDLSTRTRMVKLITSLQASPT